MMPKQVDIELPLLMTLQSLGGKAKAHAVYPEIQKHFPEMTPSDLAETLATGGSKWTNRIQWVRQALVAKGEMMSAGYGVWAISEKGLQRLKCTAPAVLSNVVPNHHSTDPDRDPQFVNLEELAGAYLDAFEQKVIQKLSDLEPAEFEQFAGVLISSYGFTNVAVTKKGKDGGIDGHGELKVGLATLKAAFQCKKWKGSVGSPEIDAFRGAIQGKFEHGYFFTTSSFSPDAQKKSFQTGAAPIILFDGHAIVKIMLEKGLGIRRKPIEIYEDQIDTLFESSIPPK